MQSLQSRVVLLRQRIGLAQRRAQGITEAARQAGHRLAFVRIRMLHHQVAEAHVCRQRGEHRRDAIPWIQVRELGEQAQLLPREDQGRPWKRMRQTVRIVTDEQYEAGVAFGARIADEAGLRGALGQFAGEFGLEALPAVAEQRVNNASRPVRHRP